MKVNFKQTKDYLDTFINYERDNNYIYKKTIKLKRVRYLFSILNIPYRKLKAIHIAGTKGKGSCANFVAYILAKSGFRVGLYTSPHFKDLRERIEVLENKNTKIIRRKISSKDVVKIIEEFKPYLEKIRFTEEFGKITFFEVYTALAFKYFLDKKLDYVVLEVGLGGRFDATNIIKPLVSIITHIGYDHIQKLGRYIKDIAYQKAGIIKRNIPVVTAQQEKDAAAVIFKKVKATNSPLFVLNRDFCFSNVKLMRNYSYFDFNFNQFKMKNVCISLKGMHQIENASLAIMATHLIIGNNKKFIRKALRETFLEGRFELVNKNPFILLDIAHNPSSFKVLAQCLKTYFPERKVILIFSASKDKDIKKMLSLIHYDKLIFTSFCNPRSFNPFKMASITNLKADITNSLKNALKIAYAYYNKKYIILISGSFFLVAEAKRIFKRKICG